MLRVHNDAFLLSLSLGISQVKLFYLNHYPNSIRILRCLLFSPPSTIRSTSDYKRNIKLVTHIHTHIHVRTYIHNSPPTCCLSNNNYVGFHVQFLTVLNLYFYIPIQNVSRYTVRFVKPKKRDV